MKRSPGAGWFLMVAWAAALACTGAGPLDTSAAPSDARQESPEPEASAPLAPGGDAAPSDAGVGSRDAAAGALALADDALAEGSEPGARGPLLADLTGKIVLHAGDSMVGGQAGLTRALEAKFKAAGVKSYKSDSWVSANLSMFHQQPRFGALLAKHRPDLVILTLGANDAFSAAPEQLISHVQAIVAKIGATPCLWISPPAFVKAGYPHAAENFQKFIDMLRDHTAPCRFYDTRVLEVPDGDGGTVTRLPRARDHIHPTDPGGALWADAVWAAELQ